MNKQIFALNLILTVYISSFMLANDDTHLIKNLEDNTAHEQIFLTLNPMELKILTDNPLDQFVYIPYEIIESFNNIPTDNNTPHELKNIKETVCLNSKIAEFKQVLAATIQALEYYKTSSNPEFTEYCNALNSYLTDLKTGRAKIITEQIPTRSRSCKSFCTLYVRDCLKAGSLVVCGNALFRQKVNIQGRLNIEGDTNVAGNLNVEECAGITRDLCVQGNIAFNTPSCGCPLNFGNGALFAQGAQECFLKNIRGTVALTNAIINGALNTVAANVTPVNGANVGYTAGNLTGTLPDPSAILNIPARLIDANFLVTLTEHPVTATQLSVALSLELLNDQPLIATINNETAFIASMQVMTSPAGNNTFRVRLFIFSMGQNDAVIIQLLTNLLNNLRIHFIAQDRVVQNQCSNNLDCSFPCIQ